MALFVDGVLHFARQSNMIFFLSVLEDLSTLIYGTQMLSKVVFKEGNMHVYFFSN